MSHQLIDERSLELHRAIAERLRANPELIDHARRNLERWSLQHRDNPTLKACNDEWIDILNTYSFEELMSLLLERSDQAQRLRQNSPFPGILSPREVSEIKRRFYHAAGQS
jgi:hypothetical protein